MLVVFLCVLGNGVTKYVHLIVVYSTIESVFFQSKSDLVVLNAKQTNRLNKPKVCIVFNWSLKYYILLPGMKLFNCACFHPKSINQSI